jgi:hypothetical protein
MSDTLAAMYTSKMHRLTGNFLSSAQRFHDLIAKAH